MEQMAVIAAVENGFALYAEDNPDEQLGFEACDPENETEADAAIAKLTAHATEMGFTEVEAHEQDGESVDEMEDVEEGALDEAITSPETFIDLDAELSYMNEARTLLAQFADAGLPEGAEDDLLAFESAFEAGDYELAEFHAHRLAKDLGKLDEYKRMPASQRLRMVRARRKPKQGARRMQLRKRRLKFKRSPSLRRRAARYVKRFKRQLSQNSRRK